MYRDPLIGPITAGSAMKIDLIYLCQKGSREHVILDVRLVLGLHELLA